MSETLQANVHISLAALTSLLVSDGTASFQMDETGFVSGGLLTGTGADQGNQLYDEVTTLLGGGGSVTLSLHDFGAVVDQLGQVRSMTAVRLIALRSLGNRFCKFVASVAVNTAGTGYLIGDLLGVASGSGTGVQFTVTNVGGGGAITGLSINSSGGYIGGSYIPSAPPNLTAQTLTGGTGTGGKCDMTLGTYDYVQGLLPVHLTPVFVDADYLTFGGDGASSAFTSLFGSNTDKYNLPSGTANLPGTLFLCGGGATAWFVGSSSINKNVKIINGGTNPVSFRLIVIGS